MPNYDEEYTLIDVVQAVQRAGANSINAQTVRNFLTLNDEYFDSDDYADMIAVCEDIRENYTDPYAERVFGKTAIELTEDERNQMWRPESEGGLSMVQRREIWALWTEYGADNGLVTIQAYDANGYAVFYHGILANGGSYDQHTGISFETERGEKPATIDFGEPLPVIPPTDGLVNTGWVNYYGEPVTSTAYADLLYSPTFKAVWEEPFYTITYQSYYGTIPEAKKITIGSNDSYAITADDLPSLHVDKYTFTGWSKTQYELDYVEEGYEINGDITLYAVWSQDVTITYHSEHGVVPQPAVVTLYDAYFFEYYLGNEFFPTLESNGYVFNGWALDKEGTRPVKAGYILMGTDLNLYAMWEIALADGWSKQDIYKDGVKHEVYQKTNNGWVKCDTYRYKYEVEE